MKTFFGSVKNRIYLYGVEGALLAVLGYYGVVDLDAIPVWLVLGAAVLGIGTSALSATNARNPEPPPVAPTEPPTDPLMGWEPPPAP